MKHRESLISAHHNYLVNNMLSPGFVLGDPSSNKDFYFLADVVVAGESTPRISARLFEGTGALLLELIWNRISENPGNCIFQSNSGGFCISHPSGETLLEVHTQEFPKGYLTRLQGRLYDNVGKLRMEPTYESIQVYGEMHLFLDSPFDLSGKRVKNH
ncbi:MAG: hypothetical protein ABII26_04445 [Pseudomonadota bacterium]